MPPKAILFDFDGVIADTGNHHIAAWQRTLAVMGWQIADEVAARSAEIDDREFLAELFAERGITEGKIDDWVRRKQLLTVQLLKDAPRLFPGVVDLVRELQGRVRLAVVSSTWRENIKTVLGAAGLAGSFDLIVGKEDVTAGKPAPDAYQLALKRLRLVARSTVALEDSPERLGVRPRGRNSRHRRRPSPPLRRMGRRRHLHLGLRTGPRAVATSGIVSG